MSKLESLPTLEQYASRVRRETFVEARNFIQRARDRANENIVKAKQTREAIAKLEAAGIEVGSFHSTYAYVELGYFSQTKAGNAALAAAVRKVRVALGCQLTQDGKEVSDAKKRLVTVTLRAAMYPSVRVQFERKLPKGAKCRIVRHRSSYSTLVCDL